MFLSLKDGFSYKSTSFLQERCVQKLRPSFLAKMCKTESTVYFIQFIPLFSEETWETDYIRINRLWFKYSSCLKGALICGCLSLAACFMMEEMKCRGLKMHFSGQCGGDSNPGAGLPYRFCWRQIKLPPVSWLIKWRYLLDRVFWWIEWGTNYETLHARLTVKAQLAKVISLFF